MIKNFFDWRFLNAAYEKNDPYAHIVLDDFLEATVAEELSPRGRRVTSRAGTFTKTQLKNFIACRTGNISLRPITA